MHRVTTYIPWSIAEGTGLLQPRSPHPYGIHGILEERATYGPPSRGSQRPDAARRRKPPPAAALGVPVLDVWHTSIDQNGKPYELTRFVMRGDLTGLPYDVPIE